MFVCFLLLIAGRVFNRMFKAIEDDWCHAKKHKVRNFLLYRILHTYIHTYLNIYNIINCIFIWFISLFNVRHLKGEEVDALSIRELQGLEMQLDTALKRTRSRKVIYLYPWKHYIISCIHTWSCIYCFGLGAQNQLMVESIAQLQKKVIYWFRSTIFVMVVPCKTLEYLPVLLRLLVFVFPNRRNRF